MLGNLEYELGKLIALIKKQGTSRCCGGRKRLKKTFNRVRKALEIEKKKPTTTESAEEIAKAESLLEELAKEVGLD